MSSINEGDRMHLNQDVKRTIVADNKQSLETSTTKWYKYRMRVIKMASEESETTAPLLKQILIILVKIYWEMKKPHANKQ